MSGFVSRFTKKWDLSGMWTEKSDWVKYQAEKEKNTNLEKSLAESS